MTDSREQFDHPFFRLLAARDDIAGWLDELDTDERRESALFILGETCIWAADVMKQDRRPKNDPSQKLIRKAGKAFIRDCDRSRP